MNYFVITSLGRQAIPMLRTKGEDDKAEILSFLRKRAATIEQISDVTQIEYSTVALEFKQLRREGWVREKRL